MGRPSLTDAVLAINTLNGFPRSKAAGRAYVGGGPRDAIYWMKKRAILHATRANAAAHRRVEVEVQCRTCGGSGTWSADEEFTRPRSEPCRRCRASGLVKLDFVETSIMGQPLFGHALAPADGIRWHTPTSEFHAVLPLTTAGEGIGTTDWRPNQPGRELTVPELVAALNTAETFFSGEEDRRWCGDTFDYSLYLGQTDPAWCGACGGPAEPSQCPLRIFRHPLTWTGQVCRRCEAKANRQGLTAFDVPPVPAELVADPHVAAWIERHSGLPAASVSGYRRSDVNGK